MVSVFANSRGRRRWAAVSAAMLFTVAGCVGATSSAPLSASTGAGPTATASTSASPTATPAATYDLSNVPLAPAGEWKSIHWLQLSATPEAALPSPQPSANTQANDGFQMAGWSQGFVGFSVQVLTKLDSDGNEAGSSTATIATTYSRDGVHWHDGTVMRQPISIDNLDIRGVFEGPSGLLAVGGSGACGEPWIEALWTSGDGVSWRKVDTRKAFGNAVIDDVSGGSTGFAATDSTGHKAWTSRDGQSWSPVNLGSPVFSSSRIDDGTAFSGGFVLAGSTVAVGARTCAGSIISDSSAPPTPAPPLRTPAIWWSADGGTWTKVELPGGTSAYSIKMSICRANDHTLVAFEYYNDDQNSGSRVWVSSDGRTWSSPTWPSNLDPSEIVTDGRHGVLAIDLRDPSGPAPSAEPSISMVSDGGGLVALAQGGDLPPYAADEHWALGPTGILWMAGDPWSASFQLWMGLPSEG
jgi:hypothetical protein